MFTVPVVKFYHGFGGFNFLQQENSSFLYYCVQPVEVLGMVISIFRSRLVQNTIFFLDFKHRTDILHVKEENKTLLDLKRHIVIGILLSGMSG